jgi:hypothetical protein
MNEDLQEMLGGFLLARRNLGFLVVASDSRAVAWKLFLKLKV